MDNELLTRLSPALRPAYLYWESKRAGRLMPARADLDPVEMVPFLADIILLDVRSDPLDFRHRLVGTNVDEHMSQPLTGRWFSEIEHQKAPSHIWSCCAAAVAEKTPRTNKIPYVGPKKDFMAIEDVMMPLSDDGETVSMLFVVTNFVRTKKLVTEPEFGGGLAGALT